MNKLVLSDIIQSAKDLKVLYVEDNEEARVSTIYLLEKIFNTIVVAVDGSEGLKKYKQDNFDLVISDINMPNLSGVEMSKAIFEQNIDQSIIIISAHNESDMLTELINIGVEYFMQKPIDFENFMQVLGKCIKRVNEKKAYEANVKKIERLNKENKNLIENFDKYVIASRTDTKGIITYASKEFCKISGYKESELIGKPHNIVRHPDMPKEAFKELWESIKAGDTWIGEVKNLKKDGGVYWVKATISPSYDLETGELLGYNAIREDITHQKEVLSLSKKINDLLNNAGEGFLSFDSNLIIENTLSKESLKLLGDEIAGKNIGKILYADDSKKRELFENIIGNIISAGDDLSKEMILSLLENELSFNDKIFNLEYKILDSDRFMLVIKDITEKKILQRKIENEKKIQKMVVAVVSNYDEFFELISEYKTFITKLDSFSNIELKREIHTFKGLFAQKEMIYLTDALHQIESKMSDTFVSTIPDSTLFESCLQKDLDILTKVLGDDFLNKKDKISIDPKSLEEIQQRIISLAKHFRKEDRCFDDLLNKIESLKDSSLKDLLSGFPTLAQNIAQKLDKPIYSFEIEGDGSIKVPQTHKPFINSLVHVFRNSIDHGIESMEQRVELGKDEIGSITCQFFQDENDLMIQISDDGKGIDVETLKAKVVDKGLLSAERVEKLNYQEQLQLIFADSVSTKDSVTKLSGRGVGLSAVKAELEKIGGTFEIESTKTKGTTFSFKTFLKKHGEINETV